MIKSQDRPLKIGRVEVFQVESVGAGFTPLSESKIMGKRQIHPLNNQRPCDRVITAVISGDSLIDEKIYDGDIAVLKLNFERYEIRRDRLVVVKCPAGVVIKHFSLTEDGQARLSSSNPDYPDLIFDLEDIEIQAIVMRIDRVVCDWS